MTTNVLIVTKGHDYDRNSFDAMFQSMASMTTTMVDQPAAQVVLQPENLESYDAVFFYDMSGIPGVGLLHDGANNTGQPPERFVSAMEALLERGVGMVLVNHATVGWPLWPLWREITGSSYLLSQGEFKGQTYPGSGYRGGHGPLPNATMKMIPQGKHPVLAGLEEGFEVTDELYLKTDGFEEDVLPLLRADYEFKASNFTPPPLAPADEQAGWDHPDGSNLLVWANACRNSPIVISEIGDGPPAFDNTDYRRLIENSLNWVASDEARQWASEQN